MRAALFLTVPGAHSEPKAGEFPCLAKRKTNRNRGALTVAGSAGRQGRRHHHSYCAAARQSAKDRWNSPANTRCRATRATEGISKIMASETQNKGEIAPARRSVGAAAATLLELVTVPWRGGGAPENGLRQSVRASGIPTVGLAFASRMAFICVPHQTPARKTHARKDSVYNYGNRGAE